jgi:hypothetical protein
VTSTIADGATLSAAVPWEATVQTGATDAVSRVEFSIDGKVRWTEKNEPYFFDDDSQLLPPWALGNGAHLLTVHALATSGAEGTATSHVTVRTDTSPDAALAGSYRRKVTAADVQRTTPYRTAALGAFGELPPVGTYTLHVTANGLLEGSYPVPDPFVEPFTVTGKTLRMYGAAVWAQPDPSKPNLFCEPEQPSDYTWHRTATTLVLTPVQHVCADRDTVLAGTWTRTGA